MKNSINKAVILIFTFFMIISVSSLSYSKGISFEDDKTAEISLPSIQCGMCVKTIEKSLGNLDGVIKTEIDLKNKTATVTYDESIIDIEKIEGAINSSGYDANDKPADAEAYNNLHGCCKKPD